MTLTYFVFIVSKYSHKVTVTLHIRGVFLSLINTFLVETRYWSQTSCREGYYGNVKGYNRIEIKERKVFLT